VNFCSSTFGIKVSRYLFLSCLFVWFLLVFLVFSWVGSLVLVNTSPCPSLFIPPHDPNMFLYVLPSILCCGLLARYWCQLVLDQVVSFSTGKFLVNLKRNLQILRDHQWLVQIDYYFEALEMCWCRQCDSPEFDQGQAVVGLDRCPGSRHQPMA
jgi:hypothetical protein